MKTYEVNWLYPLVMDQLCLRFCKGTTSIIKDTERPAPNMSVIRKFYCMENGSVNTLKFVICFHFQVIPL